MRVLPGRKASQGPAHTLEMILPSDCCPWRLISGACFKIALEFQVLLVSSSNAGHTHGGGREVRLKLSCKEETTPGRRLLPELALPCSVDNLQLDTSTQHGGIPNIAEQPPTILSGAAGKSLPVRTCFGAEELQHTPSQQQHLHKRHENVATKTDH